VVGIQEISLRMATTLGSKFTILTLFKERIPHKENDVWRNRLTPYLASVRELGMSVLETDAEPQRTRKQIMALAKRAVEDDGAEVIVLGCAGMVGYAEEAARELGFDNYHTLTVVASEQDPKQIPAAYDEILRYDMPTQFLCRRLVRDVELRGERLREGDAVMFLFASANRDEREFADPDTFDVTRRPQRILSFGAGTHACLGTHVARLEGKITFETLLARAPSYEVDLDGAERLRTEFVQGFATLPIRLRP